jgi:outer membrane protein insertion porin family
MIRTQLYIFILIGLCLLASSCSNTRHLPDGETLYTGASVNIKDRETGKRVRKTLEEDLEAAVKPKPNATVLGIRLKLTAYNLARDTSKKGFIRKGLRKFGEKPVLASSFNAERNRQLFTNLMENKGFFYPKVDVVLHTKGKKTKANFDVVTGPQYKIREVYFLIDSTSASKDIRLETSKSLLRKGDPYNLDVIKAERERIDKQLKEIGYYYFNPDYILVRADSTVGNHEVVLYVKLKEDMPPDAHDRFYINNIYVYPNYRADNKRRPNNDSSVIGLKRRRHNDDTLFYKRYYIIGNTRMYKPSVFAQAMQFAPNDVYNRTDQNMALNRLINMGTFKFVKNEFIPAGPYRLDVKYMLTPLPKKALRAELGGYTKNDSRVGSEISLSWRNRNALHGAELFAVKGSAGFEVQGSGNRRRPSTYQFSIEPSITFPRFVVPFVHIPSSSIFVPHTVLKTNYTLQIRKDLYRLNSFNFAYGFQWKEDIRKEHQFFPINITYVRTDTLNKDTTFNVNFSNLVFNGIIIGPTYEFTYNTRVSDNPRHDEFYFNGQADLSGNVLGLIQGANDSTNKETIFGQRYAQYVKFQTDFRHYLNYGRSPSAILASRILIGVGVPYGNSQILPNVKQFFSGGNSSLRGFPSRLVGPGTFHENINNLTFIETSGDLKLELNTELRTPIYKFIHGAAFIDAGNIWTYNESKFFPGGKFDKDKFLSQLAVNIGAGIRFDFKILVLRLDLGIPVRKPWLPANERWDFAFQFDRSKWRQENLILNLGIGYPF